MQDLISFKLDHDLALWLKQEAKRRDMSRSALIRVVLRKAMERSKAS